MFTGRDEQLIARSRRRPARTESAPTSRTADDNARTVDACGSTWAASTCSSTTPAYAYRAEIGALDVDEMRAMFETNVFGLVDLTNRVVPLMKAQAQGDIINIASTSGMKGAATAHRLCRQQVGGARHQPMLAGRAAAARDPRHVRLPVRGADQLRRHGPAATIRTSSTPRISRATIMAALDMPRRALWPELAVFANNPWKED